MLDVEMPQLHTNSTLQQHTSCVSDYKMDLNQQIPFLALFHCLQLDACAYLYCPCY